MAPVVPVRAPSLLPPPSPEYLAYDDSGPETPSPRGDSVPSRFQVEGSAFSPMPMSPSPIAREVPVKAANFNQILSLFQVAADRKPLKTPAKGESDSRSRDSGMDSNNPHSETFSSDENETCPTVAQKRTDMRQYRAFKPPSFLSINVSDPPQSKANNFSPSIYSPRSDRTAGSPTNSIMSQASDSVFHQMAVTHSSTLAYIAQNYKKLQIEYAFPNQIGREIAERASLSNVIFKSGSPIYHKDTILVFDGAFVGTDYNEHPVTVMISSADTYAPLLGRHADRLYGPPYLAEFEEMERELRVFLDEAGHNMRINSTLKVTVMSAMYVCSFPALAAHNQHRGMNPAKREQQVAFIMLQLLSALKCLQADGVEWLSLNFREFLLCFGKPAPQLSAAQCLHQLPRLVLARQAVEEEPGAPSPDQTRVGLCRFGLRALCTLLSLRMQAGAAQPAPELARRSAHSACLRRCAQLLSLDRSGSLTDAKQALEFGFFVGDRAFHTEFQAKLWLDECRAQYVNQAVKWLVEKNSRLVSPREQHYLYFLLSCTPRQLYRNSQLYRGKP